MKFITLTILNVELLFEEVCLLYYFKVYCINKKAWN